MTDPRTLAAKFTEAQRGLLLLLDDNWQAGPSMSDLMLTHLASFREAGLVEREFRDESVPQYSIGDCEMTVRMSACWHFRLTPLGLQVRAILRENAS